MKFKRSINTGGTGIGLYLCKELCTLLKIQISFKSIVGLGTTFIVQINNVEPEEVHDLFAEEIKE